jgi:EEF1A lysine methyltransferase 4
MGPAQPCTQYGIHMSLAKSRGCMNWFLHSDQFLICICIFMPPSFGALEYWEQRFRQNDKAFDWLLPSAQVRDIAAEVIAEAPQCPTRILHIGCGTSDLSTELRSLVRHGGQVCNVDYSQAAVEAGEAQKVKRLDTIAPPSLERLCLWRQADLLALPDIERLLYDSDADGRLFTVIIDKGTSDSIACANNVEISLPYPMIARDSKGSDHGTEGHVEKARVHPLNLLAVHLAALVAPGTGRWLAVSYTNDRFPFFPAGAKTEADGLLTEETLAAGLPDPARLWNLHQKWRVKAAHEENIDSDTSTVHRPEVWHWIYVLARTDVEVDVIHPADDYGLDDAHVDTEQLGHK